MQLIKEHHHTLLVTLFLIGALLVFGSFEVRVPDSAIAATTPGQQSAQREAVVYYNLGQPDTHNISAITKVNYTGEVRDKNTGALITSGTTLKPGDKVTLDIFADSSYFATGAWTDSPPAPWVGDNFLSKLMPSSWTYRGVFNGTELCGPENGCFSYSSFYAYEYKNFPYDGVHVSPPPSDYCPPNHLVNNFGSNESLCLQTSIRKPAITLSANGMNCGNLSESDTAEGQRKYSTICNITTSGPSAQLTANIGATSFYYPARARELSWAGGTQLAESKIAGYKSSDYDLLHYNDDHDIDFPNAVDIANFYSTGSIDAAALLWNIDVAPNPPAPTLTFTGNPTTITQGDAATMTWTSQYATSCSASGDSAESEWSGARLTSGSQLVHPAVTHTYTLTCTGSGGSVSSDVTITVFGKPDLTAQSSGVAFIQSGRKFSLISEAFAQDLLAGSPLTFTGLIANIGGSIAGPSQTRLRIDVGNNGWTAGEPQFTASTGSLAPLGVETETWQGAWIPTAGTHSFEVCADSGAAVSESNETNNCVSRTFTVSSGGFSCNAQGQCVFGGSGQGCQITNNCSGGVGSLCFGNCGAGDGGTGCTNTATCPSASNPSADKLSADTNLFCPSHQAQLNWSYSDPNGDPQAAFRAQLDDNADFSSMLMDVYKDTSDKLYVIPPNVLSFGTKYYFRIAAQDSTGAWSNWSQTADFTTPANCVVPDFALNSSNNLTANVTGVGTGSSNTTKITVTPFDQFSDTVILSFNSISPALSGAIYNFTPMTLSSGQYSSGSVFKVTIPGSTAPGDYIITITGVDGGLVRTVNVILHVNSTSPEFQEI